MTNRAGATQFEITMQVLPDGTATSDLFIYKDHQQVAHFVGTATNSPNGLVRGKFYSRGGRFHGHIDAESNVVTGLFWIPSDNGKRLLIVRRFKLTPFDFAL